MLAIMLAPTDAALGQAVVTEERIPSRIRQGLNVESGLNDGICVPLFFIALAIAEAERRGRCGTRGAPRARGDRLRPRRRCGRRACSAALALRFAARALVEPYWLQILPVAGAALAYGIADGARRQRLHRRVRRAGLCSGSSAGRPTAAR